MSPFAQVTDVDHGGAVGEEVTEDHTGSPERLRDRQHPFEMVNGNYLPD